MCKFRYLRGYNKNNGIEQKIWHFEKRHSRLLSPPSGILHVSPHEGYNL